MKREEIREQTMQLIFQMDAQGIFDFEQLTPIEENTRIINKNQAITTLTAIRDHIEDIDNTIRNNLDNWNFERIAKTDLAIIRNAVAEMLYNDDIPNGVSINEAVNMAKKYGDEKAYAFVNSVLSKINKAQ